MTPAQIQSVVCLADLLARENRALRALDLPGAAALFGDKQRAVDAFVAARTAVAGPTSPAEPARGVVERLRALAEENRTLLERAIAVQGRVLATVARAAQPVASRYGARGGPAFDAGPAAVALSARA